MDIYVVTRVDINYCPICVAFKTKKSAIEFIKKNFKESGFDWNNRFSMITGNNDKNVFPIRACEGGHYEWDIHRTNIDD